MKYKFLFLCCVILILCCYNGFSQEIIPVKRTDDHWIYVHKSTRKQAFPGEWSWADEFYKGSAKVSCFRSDGFYVYPEGLINKRGEIILPCEYDNIGDLHEDLRAICKENKVGFCDTNGKIVIPLTYRNESQSLPEFSEGLACVMLDESDGDYIFIDKQGKKAIDIEIDPWGGAAVYYLPRFKQGLAVGQKNNKFGFIDKQGKWIIKPQYDAADEFSEGLAAVRKGNTVFYIDEHGNRAFKRNLGCIDEGCCGFVYGKFVNGQAEVNISTKSRCNDFYNQHYEEIRAIIDRQGNIIKILDK
jgi:hypothetical protein